MGPQCEALGAKEKASRMLVEAFLIKNLPQDIIAAMTSNLSQEEIDRLKKRNRLKRLSPKTHQIAHEAGRSTKSLWRQIVSRARMSK